MGCSLYLELTNPGYQLRPLFLAIALSLWMPCASANPAHSTGFRWVDGWGWGGQALVTPRLVLCTPDLPALFRPRVLPPGALFGLLSVGEQARPTVLVLTGAGTDHPSIYLVRSPGEISPGRPGIPLKPGAVPWPVCRGKRSAWIPLEAGAGEAGSTPRARRAAVWLADAPGAIFFAYSGFLKGRLVLDGAPRDALLADGNGDGLFGNDARDQLWIDRSGSGKLDVATEEFPVAPVFKIQDRYYNLVVTRGGRTVALRRLTRSLGSARISMPAYRGIAVQNLSATLVSQAGDVVPVSSPDQVVTLPAGCYCVTSLEMSLAESDHAAWSYSFLQTTDARNAASYSLTVGASSPAVVAPLQRLTFTASVEGERRPGTILSIQLSVHTGAGLELVGAVDPDDQAAFGIEESMADIQLLDPAGRLLDRASSGFT